jgi:hypothetical protein
MITNTADMAGYFPDHGSPCKSVAIMRVIRAVTKPMPGQMSCSFGGCYLPTTHGLLLFFFFFFWKSVISLLKTQQARMLSEGG